MTTTSIEPPAPRPSVRTTWPGWIGRATAGFSLLYGLLGLYWWAGGAGFPFGREHDPFGEDVSILYGVGPGSAAPVIAGLGLFGAALATYMARARIRRPLIPVTLAWTYAVGLAVVIPDYRPLIRVAYTPVFVIGKVIFGWPADASWSEMYSWPVLNQMLLMSAGVMWAGTAVACLRRSRGACGPCGRTDAGTGWTSRVSAARWGRTAVYVAAVVPLVYVLPRWAWALGIPLGVSSEFLESAKEGTPEIWLMGAMLASLAVIGSVLTLGLVQRWGEIYPRWIPGLRGKPVRPRTAIIPATLVAIMVTTAGLMEIRIVVLGLLPGSFADNIATVGPSLLWPVWGVALGAATYAYYLRRRARCETCGRL